MTAVGKHLVRLRESREPHRGVVACHLVAVGAVRNREPSQQRVGFKDRELRHAQEARDDAHLVGLDAPAAVLKIGHSTGVHRERCCEISGLEPCGLSQPPDLAADGYLHSESMGESCGNRKSLG